MSEGDGPSASDGRVEQRIKMAHLRALPRCQTCDAAASEALYTGVNELVGYYCLRHGKQALHRYKEGRGV